MQTGKRTEQCVGIKYTIRTRRHVQYAEQRHKNVTAERRASGAARVNEEVHVEIYPRSSSPSDVLNISSKISFPSVDRGGRWFLTEVGSSRALLILLSRSSFQIFSSASPPESVAAPVLLLYCLLHTIRASVSNLFPSVSQPLGAPPELILKFATGVHDDVALQTDRISEFRQKRLSFSQP